MLVDLSDRRLCVTCVCCLSFPLIRLTEEFAITPPVPRTVTSVTRTVVTEGKPSHGKECPRPSLLCLQ